MTRLELKTDHYPLVACFGHICPMPTLCAKREADLTLANRLTIQRVIGECYSKVITRVLPAKEGSS